ncbi:response regulator [Paenibacillus puldeungensis]|uniref:Response regulator n=1 Tax=Paenibacillus puldeungensis TaxID=696536 RepID=A0ABW3RTE7_9BACL
MLRIVIVDDEASIREGLGKIIGKESWRFVVAGLFANGQQILDFMNEEEIDVIITDIRMPVLDGLELIKQVKSCRPEIRCIMMSGFTDFEYARQALRYSAVDYLLKPINKKQLFHLLYTLDEEKTALQNKEQHIRQGLLLSYIKCSPGLCTKLPRLSLPGAYFNVFVFKSSDLDGLQNSIRHFEHCTSSRNWDLVDTGEAGLALVCYFSKEPGDGEIRGLAKEIQAVCPLGRILVGSSPCYHEPDLLNQAYAEAKRACEFGIYLPELWGYSHILDIREPGTRSDTTELFAAYRDDLVNALQILSIPQTKTCLEGIFDQVLKQKIPLESFALLCRLIIETASAELHEWGKACSPVLGNDLEAALASCLSFREIQRKFIGEFIGILDRIRTGRLALAGKSVETVKRWIADHYDQPAELTYLANLVYLTPSYLSKLFKQETGMTITDYLIEFRIKKAKHLLRASNELKIHEIGRTVGYPDPAYFNKLFKRMVGLTPNEYKKIT